MKAVEILRPFVRDGNFPLDATTIFYSYNDAVEYAHNNLSAYPTQVIGVDDKSARRTGLYQISYDPNKQFRYILEEVGIGIGGSTFRFKGSVATYEDLPQPPEIIANGDMYLVENPESALYVAFKDSQGNVSWKKLTLNVNVSKVTKTNDGLMSKELYSTMYNETGNDAVYFSKKNGFPNPEHNTWILVEHTEKEEENGNYSLASVGKTKEIVGSLLQQSTPHIEVIAIGDYSQENAVNSQIKPQLRIYYYPELGGDINEVFIYRKINGNVSPTPVYHGYPDLITDANNKYFFDWTESEFQTSTIDTTIEYMVIVTYLPTTDGNMTGGECSGSISYYFYQKIFYGTNLENYETFLKENTKVLLEYNPSQFEERTNKIFISIPKTAELSQVTYIPQNDTNALDFFTPTDQNTYVEFEYNLGQYSYFSSRGSFEFNITKRNN